MSEPENWTIVQFTNEGSVDCILSKWLINHAYCWWPNSFSLTKIRLSIKQHFNPELNWKKCSIRCLSKTPINNFKLASKIANQATMSSDDELFSPKFKYPKPNDYNGK